MRKVAIICPKGGTGKTSLTIALAVEHARTAASTSAPYIIDTTPEASAHRWSRIRVKNYPDQQISCIPCPAADIDRALTSLAVNQRPTPSLVLIDTAGGAYETMSYVIRRADLILIPFRATALDINTLESLKNFLNEHEQLPRSVVVLTCIQKRRIARAEQWRRVFTGGRKPIPTIKQCITQLTVWEDSYLLGLGPQEYGKAATRCRTGEEIASVYTEIREFMDQHDHSRSSTTVHPSRTRQHQQIT